MIPRYQTVLFFLLLAASIVMGGALWQLRNREHQHVLQGQQSTPTQAPQVAPNEQATLVVASDSDDSLSTRALSLPLPPSAGARARAILGKLLDLYAAPDAAHPAQGGAASIEQVFLLPVAKVEAANVSAAPPATATAKADGSAQSGPEIAVVNLAGAFVNNHPSGIETESLTVLSICATLHANFPRITEVRFLVDGQQHETLAGHADLTRTYLATQVLASQGSQP
ncbi:MAG TPA: GerMN domain-containing protein [Terracidiphilus sp.]|nr:GerMN domain-containing protein [Terracidiphilus sp.]